MIIVNGVEFKTKQKLREYIRQIRDQYADYDPLNNFHLKFMSELLMRHEDPYRKIGCGILSMYVKTNPIFKNNRGFYIKRIDGSETDFSFEICLKNETRLQKFKQAARTAISEDIIGFKKAFFRNHTSPICEVTGELLTSKNCHVDHAPPNTFEQIIKRFIEDNHVNIETINLLDSEDNRIRNEFADKEFEHQFILYHNELANLRVISRLANLSIVKKTR